MVVNSLLYAKHPRVENKLKTRPIDAEGLVFGQFSLRHKVGEMAVQKAAAVRRVPVLKRGWSVFIRRKWALTSRKFFRKKCE